MTETPKRPKRVKQTAEERDAERARELDAYIERLVNEAPPLTEEQRARLAVLLGTRW